MKAPHCGGAPGDAIIFSDCDITLVSEQLQTRGARSSVPNQDHSMSRESTKDNIVPVCASVCMRKGEVVAKSAF